MEQVFEHLMTVYNSLTDFQKATVETIISKFNNGNDRRVLVADEVGLGKTIVAKGIIAKLLEKKMEKNDGILKVTYICSNLALAQENRSKLAIFSGELSKKYVQDPSFNRLAELGLKQLDVDDRKILEVCSLTPGTSFNLTQGPGNMRERYIIYRALVKQPEFFQFNNELSDFFQYGVKDLSWDYQRYWFEQREFDECVLKDFSLSLYKQVSLPEKDCAYLNLRNPTWIDLLSGFIERLDSASEYDDFKWIAYHIRCHLRVLFVQCCAKNLSADLFILDEFQRFKELIDTQLDTEQGLIAKEVFQKQDDSKVLLLSATPYKAISKLNEDEVQEAHLDELRKLLKFLSNGDSSRLKKYELLREDLLSQVLRLMDTEVDVSALDYRPKEKVEDILRPLICRTERAQVAKGFEALMKTKHATCEETFSRKDIESFVAMDQLGQRLKKKTGGRNGSQLLEFFKSAPWPLSFLSGYQFGKQLKKHFKDPEIKKALKSSKSAWLSFKKLERYALDLENDAPNAKIILLSRKVFGENGEKLLWIPPSMPYYQNHGPFAISEDFSKTLLFSAFILAPRALSGLLSYQAEKRLLPNRGRKPYYFGSPKSNDSAQKKIGPIIRFDGRSSLVPWALIYPCKLLTNILIEPGQGSLNELIKNRKDQLSVKVERLRLYEDQSARKTDNWYALAPFLLDLQFGNAEYVHDWIDYQLKKLGSEDRHHGRYLRLGSLEKLIKTQDLKLGPMPADLGEFIAKLSLAGPGICLARTSFSLWPEVFENNNHSMIDHITRGAIAFAQMFNKPESQRILKTLYKGVKKHWRSLLDYCAAGNVQAMLDEYGHLLKGAGNDFIPAIEKLESALGITTSSVTAQLDRGKKAVILKEVRLSCHYAVPLGNQKMTDGKGIERVANIRDAFNSPFRPFVLSSTSIGQEGLDFHWYCSRVVHWNLPQNPIDLEQREGRINRYKSLTVRRRLAEKFQNFLNGEESGDLWTYLFSAAEKETKDSRESDLIPYWHIPEGEAELERFIPMFPMSRETERLDEILKILSLYRLAFGQPRQQELLENLLHRDLDENEMDEVKKKLVIDLSPLNY